MNPLGTMKSRRLHVYPNGVGFWLVGTSVTGECTVCRVMAAGIVIIANMAITIPAQIAGLGSP
jgi:hypothetical protein